MLKITSPVLRFGFVVAAVALLPLTEAAAQSPVHTPVSPERDCLISAGGGATVRIVAGPGGSTAAAFPVMTQCPSPYTGTCLEWEYNYFYAGFNPSNVVVAVDADVKVITSAPTAFKIPTISGDTTTGFGINNAGEVGFRFNSNATSFTAKVYTPVGVSVGTVTAGFHGGNRRGFCAIAGAGSQTGDPKLSVPLGLETSTLGCTVRWTLTPDGCASNATVTSGSCTVSFNDPVSGGTSSASCGLEISVPGSCTTRRYNTILRTWTTVTCAAGSTGCTCT